MTPSGSRTPTSRIPGQLTFQQLREASGIDSEEIRHYIDQDLLPPPSLTSGSTAAYDENCVELLKLIQTFHHKHSLPLSLIKQVIHEVGYKKAHLLTAELEEKLHQARRLSWLETLPEIDKEQTFTREEFLEAADMSPDDLEEAIRQNLLAPDEAERFTQKDLDVAVILSEIKKNNDKNSEILSGLLHMRLKMTEALVEEEFTVFLKNIVNNTISVEDANELANKSFDLLVDLFPKCYWQLLNRKMRQLLAKEKTADNNHE